MELSRRSLLLASFGGTLPVEEGPLPALLSQLGWEKAARAPLLVVLPDPKLARRLPLASLPARPTLAELATAMGRQVTRLPSLTCLTPTHMDLLALPTGPPEAAVTWERADTLTRLLTTLDTAQWARLTSAQGLGATDLQPEQLPLLQRLVGRITQCWRSTPTNTFVDEAELSERERAALRIQLSRVLQLGVPAVTEDDPDADVHYLYSPERYLPQQSTWHIGESASPNLLVRRVPAKPKASELSESLLGLERLVSLEGAATLGELLARVSRAARLELHTDPRVAKLPLWVAPRAPLVPVRDVLQALALSVTGTFRRVGPAFVLTDDRVGIGTRLAKWHLWWASAQALRDQELDKDYDKLCGKGKGLSWAPGADLGLPAAQLGQLLSGEELTLSPSALPAGVLSNLEAELRESQAKRKAAADLEVIPSLSLSVILPGRGSVVLETIDTMRGTDRLTEVLRPDAEPEGEAPLARDSGPVAWSAGERERVLLAHAKDATEAKALVRLAQTYGFSRLALSAERQVLVEVGTVAARLVVPLLAPLAVSDPALADLTLLGEPSRVARARLEQAPLRVGRDFRQTAAQLQTEGGDWARFDTPEQRATLLLRAVSRVKGLGSGAVFLCDTESVGYEDTLWGSPTLAGLLGWTPARRLAFLRRSGRDPLDVLPDSPQAYGLEQLPLAFFPHDAALSQAWKALLERERVSFLAELTAALTKVGRIPRLIPRWEVHRLEQGTESVGVLRSLAQNSESGTVYLDARALPSARLEPLLAEALVAKKT